MSSIKHFLRYSSSRGVTTTHPWCSVFMRLFSFIFSRCRIVVLLVFNRLKNCVKMKDTFKKAFSFVFCCVLILCSTLNNVSAAISDIPQMTDWQFAQAIDAYAGLTNDQKDIANFLVGAQGYAYAGLAQSNLNSNFSSYSDVVNYVKDFGAKMWSEFNEHVDGVVTSGRNNLRAIKNDLSNFFGNSVSYAKTRSESFSAWLGNVGIDYNSSSSFRVQFGKDQVQNNTDFFGDQGLYNWQFADYIWNTEFSWIPPDLSGVALSVYNSQVSQLGNNKFLCNVFQSYQNRYSGVVAEFPVSKNSLDIFINTSNNTIKFMSDNYTNLEAVCADTNDPYYQHNYNAWLWFYTVSFNSNNFNSLAQLVQYYLNQNPNSSQGRLCLFDMGHGSCNFKYSDLVRDVYYGTSWDNRILLDATSDFNLSSTSQYVTINAPTNVIYLDLTGFMRDLYDNQTIIYNYVINNSVDGDGNPVDGDDFSPTSKFPGIPDSGITIGTEFFKINGLNPFFGPDGYIAVLWNNTKGLVSYLASVLSMLTFDGGNSPAFVIYGAIAVGVIGGIFSKFLL